MTNPLLSSSLPANRWILADPLGVQPTYIFPINPNKMSDPVLRKQTSSLGTSPISGASRGTRSHQHSPREWTFSGVTRTKAEQDAFLAWFDLDRKLWLRDHFARVWEIRLMKFAPEPRRSLATNNYRFQYTFTARAYRRITA